MVNNMDKMSKAMMDPQMSQPILCLMNTAPAYKSAWKQQNKVMYQKNKVMKHQNKVIDTREKIARMGLKILKKLNAIICHP